MKQRKAIKMSMWGLSAAVACAGSGPLVTGGSWEASTKQGEGIAEVMFAQSGPQAPPPVLPGQRPGQRPGQLPGRPGKANEKEAEDLVKVRAFADVEEIEAGKTFHIVVMFEIEPEWHIYWENSGASGAATVVQVEGPSGYEIGAARYPRPVAHEDEEGVSYVYEGTAALFVPVTPSADMAVGAGLFSVDVRWMVCKEVCLLGSVTKTVNVSGLTLKRPGEEGLTEARVTAREQFKRVPGKLEKVSKGKAVYEDGKLVVSLRASASEGADIYPLVTPGVKYTGKAEVSEEEGELRMSVPVEINENDAMGEEMVIRGVVVLGGRARDAAYEFAVAVKGEGPGEGEEEGEDEGAEEGE